MRRDLDRFSTPRLLCERMTIGHLPDLRRLDQDEQVMAMLGGVRTGAETIACLERNLAHWSEHGFGMWILRDPRSGETIGRGGLRHLDVDGTDEVELGYGFLPAYWGAGLATELARACVSVGRDRLGLGSLVAVTRPANTASQRVMLKAGLVFQRQISLEGEPHVVFRTR
jgi:RimJ/RimL family protein N-acetyltransferase